MLKTKIFKLSILSLTFLVGSSFAEYQQNKSNANAAAANNINTVNPGSIGFIKKSKNGRNIEDSKKIRTSLSASNQEKINKMIKAEIEKAANLEAIAKNSKTFSENESSKREQKSVVGNIDIAKDEQSSNVLSPKDTSPGKTTTVKEQAKSEPRGKGSKKPTSPKENQSNAITYWNSSSNTSLYEKNQNSKSTPGVKNYSFVNNERLNITLSNKDINRVLVKGDKIQAINGPSGLFSAKNDQQGAVYINTVGEAPFTIFVSTLKGRSLSLLVFPSQEISGKTIVLIPTSQPETRWEETDNYQKTLITLMSHMINNTETEEYDYREVKKAKIRNFYNIAEVKTLAIYEGSYLYGTVSEIKNKTRKALTLKPSYFYQPGVRAVALLHQMIPGGSTSLIYRVIGR